MSTTRKVKVEMVVGDDQIPHLGEAVRNAIGEMGEVKVCENIKDRNTWLTIKNESRYHGIAADARKAPIVVQMHGMKNPFGVYIEENGQISVSMDSYNTNYNALGEMYQGRKDRQTFAQAVSDQLLAIQNVENIKKELNGQVKSWEYRTQEKDPTKGEIVVTLDLPGMHSDLKLTRKKESKNTGLTTNLGGGL